MKGLFRGIVESVEIHFPASVFFVLIAAEERQSYK